MEYKRSYYQQVKERLLEQRLRLQVIVGPRQIGKTTLIGQVLKDIDIPYDSHTADDACTSANDWLTSVWENARLKMHARKADEFLLVIDEIQKISNWSETVKAEWDKDTRENRNLKVVLLGSSRTLIMQGLTESLAGRFELIRLPHWTYTEMHEAFGWSIEQYIYYGGYPGTTNYINDPKRWRQYVKDSLIEPSITRDVLFSTKIAKPQLLRQLFEIGCSYSGELLSLTKITAQLQDAGNVTTLANYLNLLNEAGLLGGLQKFANDKARKYNSIPKYQVHNSALRNAYEETPFNEAIMDSKIWGRLTESAIGAFLISQSQICDFDLYYWRNNNEEVDFVLQRRKKIVAIEVKSGRRQTNKGIASFKQEFHPLRTIVVGNDGYPIEDFLSIDLNILFE